MNPQNDGKVIRLVFPPLNEERRKELTKDVSKLGEEAKVAIRAIRRDAIEKLKEMKKAGDITEDDFEAGRKEDSGPHRQVREKRRGLRPEEREGDYGYLSRKGGRGLGLNQNTGCGKQAACPHRHHHGRQRQVGQEALPAPFRRPSGGCVQFSHHHPLLLPALASNT